MVPPFPDVGLLVDRLVVRHLTDNTRSHCHTWNMGRDKAIDSSGTPHVTVRAMQHPLATARRTAGLTQEQLAELVGCDRQSIARIETNRQNPSVNLISKIKFALLARGVDLSADAFVPKHEGAA